MTSELQPSDDPLKLERDKAFQNLGRNLALFQQLEQALKLLLSRSKVAGSNAEEIARFLRVRTERIEQSTLGELVGTLRREVLASDKPGLSAQSQVTMTTRFRIGYADGGASKVGELEELVRERNETVHQLLRTYDPWSSSGIAAMEHALEPQAMRVRAQIAWARTAYQEMAETQLRLAEFVQSPQFINELNPHFLDTSAFVVAMIRIANEACAPDGWMPLVIASQRLYDHDADLAREYKTRFGYKTLKSAMTASGRFEFRNAASGGKTPPVEFRVIEPVFTSESA